MTAIDVLRGMSQELYREAEYQLYARGEAVAQKCGFFQLIESRDAAASHEAGHVVAYCAAQGVPRRVVLSAETIRIPPGVPNRKRRKWAHSWGGSTHLGNTVEERAAMMRAEWSIDPARTIGRHMINFLAGLTGERVYGARKPNPGSSIDEVIAAEVLGVMLAAELARDFEEVYSAVESVTNDFLVENRAVGEKLTAMLMNVSELNAETIARVCASVRRVDVGQEIRARLSLSD